jgi:hypothetical protein
VKEQQASVPLRRDRAGELRVRTFSTNSRPALRAAACRPPARQRHDATGRRATPSALVQRQVDRSGPCGQHRRMRGVIQRLDEWGEARPWLTAVCAGLVLAAILATIELVVDDTPDWPLTVMLAVAMTLAWGFKGQFQRR